MTDWVPINGNGMPCDLCDRSPVVGTVEVTKRDRSRGGIAGRFIFEVCIEHYTTVGKPVRPRSER